MKQKGFGLMELLVVVGIIAILGAIALPQYNKYLTRTRITEVLHHGQVYARKLAEGTGGLSAEAPTGLDYATIARVGSGKETLVKIKLKDGIDSDVIFGAEDETAAGKVLVLTPEGTSDVGRWVCSTNAPAKFMPKVCTSDPSVDGSGLAWVPGTTDKDACWDEDYADGTGGGNGWVEGENQGTSGYSSDEIRAYADRGHILSAHHGNRVKMGCI